MTRRRTLPPREAREYLDLLKGYGLPLEKCTIGIGPDGVKVSPPANSNAGETLDEIKRVSGFWTGNHLRNVWLTGDWWQR